MFIGTFFPPLLRGKESTANYSTYFVAVFIEKGAMAVMFAAVRAL